MTLDQLVAAHALRGYHTVERSPDMAVMVLPQRPNHVLHLILTLVTFGLWAPVWLVLALTVKDHRVVLTPSTPSTLYLTHAERNVLGME